MNNQFSQKVSDIIVYSKEEANRLKSSYIGPEHLLLGMLRDGEGKAIEILSKLKTNLTDIKKQIEAILKEHADDMLLPDADVPLSNGAAKILKLCILEARVMKSQVADTEHVLLAILKDKDNLAATVLEANHVNYQQVFEQLSLQPDISAGMGFGLRQAAAAAASDRPDGRRRRLWPCRPRRRTAAHPRRPHRRRLREGRRHRWSDALRHPELQA